MLINYMIHAIGKFYHWIEYRFRLWYRRRRKFRAAPMVKTIYPLRTYPGLERRTAGDIRNRVNAARET